MGAFKQKDGLFTVKDRAHFENVDFFPPLPPLPRPIDRSTDLVHPDGGLLRSFPVFYGSLGMPGGPFGAPWAPKWSLG